MQTSSAGVGACSVATKDIFPPLDVDADIDDILAEVNRDDLLSDDDNNVSLAAIKSQMGFADDEHGTFLGLPEQSTRGTDTAVMSIDPLLELNLGSFSDARFNIIIIQHDFLPPSKSGSDSIKEWQSCHVKLRTHNLPTLTSSPFAKCLCPLFCSWALFIVIPTA